MFDFILVFGIVLFFSIDDIWLIFNSEEIVPFSIIFVLNNLLKKILLTEQLKNHPREMNLYSSKFFAF